MPLWSVVQQILGRDKTGWPSTYEIFCQPRLARICLLNLHLPTIQTDLGILRRTLRSSVLSMRRELSDDNGNVD
jgi:hypothetical protein